MADKSNRGFASMDDEKQREIASKGGKAAHEKGTAHEFTSEEAAEAGRKGGEAAHEKGTATSSPPRRQARRAARGARRPTRRGRRMSSPPRRQPRRAARGVRRAVNPRAAVAASVVARTSSTSKLGARALRTTDRRVD